MRKNNRNISWWNQELAKKRRKFRKLFNVAKKLGTWTDYKLNLKDYSKVLRQAKTETWRRHCEENEKTPECARLHNIPSKDVQSTISSIQLENGEHTTKEKGTMEEFFRIHLPGSEIISEPSEGWDGLEMEFPKRKGSREDWVVSEGVINYCKLKWVVFSFQPYKSPGVDGIKPIILQQGFELLGGKLLLLLRTSLALGYIPMRWKHARVVFIPKPGNHWSTRRPCGPLVSCPSY